MSNKATKRGRRSLADKRLNMRDELWGDELETLNLWDRKTHDGFTTIPRTMPQIFRIMDKFSGKGKPLASTYFTLWCNVYDESYLEIKEKERFAFESGFSGERAVTTWTTRMRLLQELGFISAKEGALGEFNHVLILNPLIAAKKLYDSNEKDGLYNALISRMSDVGASFE